MLIVFTRAIIIYVFLLIAMRLMGKKQLGELQPFEFAITLIVAELACIPMGDSTVPIVYGLVPIFTLFIVHLLFSKIVKHSVKFRKIVNGRPVIVISSDGIDFKAMNSLDMTVHDLLEALRGLGYFSPAEIEYAIIETNGSLTALPKPHFKPITLSDMQIAGEAPEIPYTIICEGKLLENNVDKCKIPLPHIKALLEKYKYTQQDILLMTIAGGDKVYLQAKNQPFISARLSEVAQ